MPRANWLKGVDIRRPLQPKEEEPSTSSDSPSPVSEKIRGKRPAVDEPVQKRRKTASSTTPKTGGVTLGEDRTTQPRRNAVLEWSDDDEDPATHAPSMKAPSTDAETPKQQARRSYVWATTEVPATQTTKVPEQQEGITVEQHTEGAPGHQTERHPVVEEQESSHQADQAAAPGGSGRHRRFKKFNQKAKS